jgi:4-hydroxyproline epimerase
MAQGDHQGSMRSQGYERIRVIDSHTAGEPTRVVIEGGPDLGRGPLAARRGRFQSEYDRFRSAVVNEPRGSEVMVGALLVPPSDASCIEGVIFFNNVGYLGMCGHGTIGVIATLAHLGRVGAGEHRLETPVGVVTARLHDDGSITLTNVPSHRAHHSVGVEIPEVGPVVGDVAWGGNWFFLVKQPQRPLTLANVEELTALSWKIREAVNAAGYPEVDHVELFGSPTLPGAHSRNFVLCPGKAYDRSPCGTGTSAKLACLAADNALAEGVPWIQESIIGSTFTGRYRWLDRTKGIVEPTITGTAFINAESMLLLSADDPFGWGIR